MAAGFVDWSDHLQVKGRIQMAILPFLRRCLRLVVLVLLSLGKPLMEVGRLDPVAVEEQQHCRQDHQEGKQKSHYKPNLTVILDRPTVHAASESWLLTEGWCPASITVAIPITVTHPVAVTACDASLQLGKGGILASAVSAHLSLATLGAGHDEAGVRQVTLAILGAVDIGASTLHLDAVRLDGGVNGHSVGAFGLLGGAVTLDLTTLGITFLTLHVVAMLIFPTVSKSIPCCIDIFKAGIMGRSGSVAPELQALLFVGEAHAVVAVGHSGLAGRAVQQVDVGGTVRRSPGAVLWQVTCPRRAPAHGTCLL